MTRKFVQIAAMSAGAVTKKDRYLPAVIGLADDGTVWYSVVNPKTAKFEKWEAMPDITETECTPPLTA